MSQPRYSLTVLAAALLLTLAATTFGQAAPLGAPDYKPTPERPYGWRGDWTGRFTGATPPVEWSRRAKAITSQLMYQADKPAGEPGAPAKNLEYFTIKDWLVAGPFSVSDPVDEFSKDFLGGEAAVQPAKGAKAGDTTWTFLRADVDTQSRHECNGGTCGNTNVDFLYAFGKISGTLKPKLENAADFENKLAYAHTYIYSPAEAKVQLQLPFDGKAARFWLNGQPTNLDPKARGKRFEVSLSKGWNRLLVKIATDNGVRGKTGDAEWSSRWLFAAYLTPTGPVSYETKNIPWMTRMTGRSMSQPIIVGDRIFIGSGITDLLCLDKKTGKILWLRSNTPYESLTPEDRAALPGMKDKIEPLVAKLEALNAQWVAAANAAISPQGLTPAQQTELDQLARTRNLAERAIHDAFAALNKKKFPPMFQNEVASSNATPCSDGQFVYSASGGGANGAGAYVLSCFSLDGQRLWSVHDGGSLGVMEHGNHSSPNLIDGKLIFAASKTLVAFDPKTGKELWRNTSKDWADELCISSPVAVTIAGASAILANRYFHRASDGSVICTSNIQEIFTSCPTPVVEEGKFYFAGQFVGNGKCPSFLVGQVPTTLDKGAKSETLWLPDGKDVTTPLRGANFLIASPLLVNGIAYSIEMSGGLNAIDPAAHKGLYHQWLDGYNRFDRMLYGVCACPTLAGKNIYIIDDAGFTHIVAPGPQFKELHRNVLENIFTAGVGGNPCQQESFYTSPVFEGKLMYLRGEEYLYCIGGN